MKVAFLLPLLSESERERGISLALFPKKLLLTEINTLIHLNTVKTADTVL